MVSLSNKQVETLAEGLLHLQVRLNNLTIRLYRAANAVEKLYTTQQRPKVENSEEEFVSLISR